MKLKDCNRFVRNCFYTNGMKTIFIIYLLFVFIQDIRTMYYSKYWFYSSVLIGFLVWKPYDLLGSLFGALLFSLPAACIYKIKKNWIGIADVLFLAYFGAILGYERMLVAMFIALFVAFIWAGINHFFFKKDEIPFVSCLVIGVIISLYFGYRIYYQILL